MRQIKFRVWDKLDKRYIYPDKDYHFVINLNGKFQNFQNGSGGDEYEIQQFTGLKDVDGVDIYEGDIVEWVDWQEYHQSLSRSRHREPVTFNHGVFWADLPLYEVNEVCKIVGNIFEDKKNDT